jgi:hypothetical protein
MGAPAATPPPAPNPPVLTTPCPSSLRYPNCSPRAGVRGLDGVITPLRYPSLVTRHSLLETRTCFKEDCNRRYGCHPRGCPPSFVGNQDSLQRGLRRLFLASRYPRLRSPLFSVRNDRLNKWLQLFWDVFPTSREGGFCDFSEPLVVTFFDRTDLGSVNIVQPSWKIGWSGGGICTRGEFRALSAKTLSRSSGSNFSNSSNSLDVFFSTPVYLPVISYKITLNDPEGEYRPFPQSQIARPLLLYLQISARQAW